MGIGATFIRGNMDPVTNATLNEALMVVNRLAPIINGIWVLMSAMFGTIIWFTYKLTKYDSRLENVEKRNPQVDSTICSLTRDACEKQRTTENTHVREALEDIKSSILRMEAKAGNSHK